MQFELGYKNPPAKRRWDTPKHLIMPTSAGKFLMHLFNYWGWVLLWGLDLVNTAECKDSLCLRRREHGQIVRCGRLCLGEHRLQ
jgi:hypothetical protein